MPIQLQEDVSHVSCRHDNAADTRLTRELRVMIFYACKPLRCDHEQTAEEAAQPAEQGAVCRAGRRATAAADAVAGAAGGNPGGLEAARDSGLRARRDPGAATWCAVDHPAP